MQDLCDVVVAGVPSQTALVDDLAYRATMLRVAGDFFAKHDVPPVRLGQPLQQKQIVRPPARSEPGPRANLRTAGPKRISCWSMTRCLTLLYGAVTFTRSS